MKVIDGEVAQPDPRVTWTCPECGRVRVDERGELVGVTCSSAGRGVGQHPLRWMVASGRPTVVDLTYVEPARQIRRLQVEQLRRVVEADQLTALELGGPGWCSECGYLVEVDNPLRREVRHRRGCTQGAAW